MGLLLGETPWEVPLLAASLGHKIDPRDFPDPLQETTAGHAT